MQVLTKTPCGWLLVGLLIGLGSFHRMAAAIDRPNILWITAEDMSPTLGCWGDAYAKTPHIDALAKRSVKYSHVFATAPVCSPVRSCLITGCYATTLGTQRLRSQFPIPSEIKGFPSFLRKAGYYCTNNVKTDYNTANARAIIAESWDDCSKSAHWRKRPNGRPFFAVFNDMTSHQSRTMVMPYASFQNNVQNLLKRDDIHDPNKAPVPPYYPDTPLIRKSVARYYDCISVMDQNVGKLLKQLEDDGLTDNTIVFFYSDHGSGMPRHKRALLDTGMHVPLLVHFPAKYQHLASGQPGKTVDQLISFVDFAPTMLNLCGIQIADYMQGFPFLGRGSDRRREYVYGARDRVDEAFDVARSIRDHRYLYIRNFMPHISYHQPSFYADQGVIREEITRFAQQPGGQRTPALWHYAGPTRPVEELYDVQSDPVNLKNLVADPRYRVVLGTMRKELEQWIFETRDLGFLPEEEVWPRLDGNTPYEIAKDPKRYPLHELFQAASLVGLGHEEPTLRKLMAGLKAKEPGVRYWSVVGLDACGDRARLTEAGLLKSLADTSSAVRIEAAGVLARIGNVRQAMPTLIKELESSDLDVVLHAARTIELLGEKARPAKPAMRAARKRAEGQEGDQHMFIRFSTDAFLNAGDD